MNLFQKNHPKSLSLLFIAAVLFCSLSAQAIDLYVSSETSLFNPADKTRVGIEVEFTNLSQADTVKALQSQIGGTPEYRTDKIITTLKGYVDGKAVYNSIDLPVVKLVGTSIGNVEIKIETNQISDTQMAMSKNVTVEVVTDPISGIEKVQALQRAMDVLKQKGAVGTTATNAVATQVNREYLGGDREAIQHNVKDLVSLMKNYFRPEHRQQVAAHLNVPAIRRPYVGEYSPGFMARLADPKYNPSWRELYDDYMYRQSLELFGDKDAWKMPLSEVKKRVLAKEVHPTVVKQNALRITSLLGFVFPEDPMTIKMKEEGWVRPGPYVEFREFNNDFDIMKPTKFSLGLADASARYGYFDHDHLMAELSGVEESMIQKIRGAYFESQKTGNPLVWRYFLADLKDPALRAKLEKYQQEMYGDKPLVGRLAPKETGVLPLTIPGNSVVMHRRPIHRSNIVGAYNPGLINSNIAQILENKYVESQFWNEMAPGAIPRTKLLSDVITNTNDIRAIAARLNQQFPKGWIIKGVWDLGTEGMLITEKTDLVKELEAFRKSDFLAYKAKIEADATIMNRGHDFFMENIGKHPNFKGWQIQQLLDRRDLMIVQHRENIVKEFRVEALGGRILGDGSTIDRYYYKHMNDPKWPGPSAEEIASVEKYAQALIDKLPADLRGTPFALDVAVTTDGRFILIESNPGSNSNFLYEEELTKSIQALGRFLDRFPEDAKAGRAIANGKTNQAQMSWIQEKFKKWNIPVPQMYAGFTFTGSEVVDAEFPTRKVEPTKFGNPPSATAAPATAAQCAHVYNLLAPN